MILIPFEPGDQTRYLVAFDLAQRVPDRPIPGLTQHSYMFVWGLEEHLSAHTFERSPNHTDLSWEYYTEKMPRALVGTFAAHVELVGFYVLAHLLGRRTFGAPWDLATMGWSEDWQEQLQPIMDQLRADDFAVEILQKYDAAMIEREA